MLRAYRVAPVLFMLNHLLTTFAIQEWHIDTEYPQQRVRLVFLPVTLRAAHDIRFATLIFGS